MADPVWTDGVTPLNAANMTKLQTRDEKGAANGYAPLDGTGVVPATNLPVVSGVPAGAMTMYVGSSAPTGWLLCDGTAVSRTTYAALYAVIGTVYGSGDGSTTFNLPDLQGRMPVGRGTHADVNALGKSEGVAVASRRPAHPHTNSLTLPNHTHNVSDPTHNHGGASGATSFNARAVSTSSSDQNVMIEGVGGGLSNHTHTIPGGATGISVGNPPSLPGIGGAIGAAGGANDQPAFLVVNYIVKT